ncbi:hypothetical protein JW962_00080 [Candidatus Dojkabacteria bacterium]|nr:hypothetical protein [Candidatus Dojkabacteria bacterium]
MTNARGGIRPGETIDLDFFETAFREGDVQAFVFELVNKGLIRSIYTVPDVMCRFDFSVFTVDGPTGGGKSSLMELLPRATVLGSAATLDEIGNGVLPYIFVTQDPPKIPIDDEIADYLGVKRGQVFRTVTKAGLTNPMLQLIAFMIGRNGLHLAVAKKAQGLLADGYGPLELNDEVVVDNSCFSRLACVEGLTGHSSYHIGPLLRGERVPLTVLGDRGFLSTIVYQGTLLAQALNLPLDLCMGRIYEIFRFMENWTYLFPGNGHLITLPVNGELDQPPGFLETDIDAAQDIGGERDWYEGVFSKASEGWLYKHMINLIRRIDPDQRLVVVQNSKETNSLNVFAILCGIAVAGISMFGSSTGSPFFPVMGLSKIVRVCPYGFW